MNNFLLDCELNILNDVNIEQYLKHRLIETNAKQITHEKSVKQKESNTSFFPKEQDSLFWCYYLITNGDIKYELLHNRNVVTTKQLKIECISKLRENKSIVKMHKFDSLTNIENNLVNENVTNIKSIMALFAVDGVNIILVNDKTYFELMINSTNNVYIINESYQNSSKYVKRYGYEVATEDKLNKIRDTLFKISNIDKPIKSISSYTLSELLDIANKLAIQTTNISTGKKKTKNELYELIVQYLLR